MSADPQPRTTTAPNKPEAVKAVADDLLPGILAGLAEKYGRLICQEPQRCEAMLRDLCPERRREIFLLVAALKEQIVADLMISLDKVADDILIARSVRKLRDNLGLAEDSAAWAVATWLPVARVLASQPERAVGPSRIRWSHDMVAQETVARQLDWVWFSLCGTAILCSAVALGVIGHSALVHQWSSLRDWFIETAILSGGLLLSGGGLVQVARQLRSRRTPDHHKLPPNQAAAAMLLEVIVLLALPLVPVSSVALWAGEWIGELHLLGQAHDLSFHLGRILQSILLGLFVYIWGRSMISVHGSIASSMIGRR